MDAFEAKMKSDGCSDAAISAFRHNYEQLVQGVTGMIDESEIDPVEVRVNSIKPLHAKLPP